MTIGQRIRAYRKERGLTQNRLGALCGLTGGAISSYENGVTIPKKAALARIAGALGLPESRFQESGALPAQREGEGLYDGILTLLRELYGMVEGKTVMGEGGETKRYYVVSHGAGSFVLYEGDVAALARSAEASLTPLAAWLRQRREGA